MDAFDEYLYEELKEQYKHDNLSDDDYEEIFQRFSSIDYLEEVKPYLLAMRFMGYGVASEETAVLKELSDQLLTASPILRGLYYDLLLLKNSGNQDAKKNLLEMVARGYSAAFLKDKSSVGIDEEDAESVDDEEYDDFLDEEDEDAPIEFKSMIFEGKGFSGTVFTTGDIDYLNAKIFIEPYKHEREIVVRSQIFRGDKAFSKVFSDTFSLKPGTTWLRTVGWGNTNFNCYSEGKYEWRIEVEDKVYCQTFRFVRGPLQRSGVPVTSIKLFSSKASGALKEDQNRYSTTFSQNTLEYVYFKTFINEPGRYTTVQVFLKVTNIEKNKVVYDKNFFQELDPNTIAFWYGIGYTKAGSWDKGLYSFTLRIGNGIAHEGTFTVV